MVGQDTLVVEMTEEILTDLLVTATRVANIILRLLVTVHSPARMPEV